MALGRIHYYDPSSSINGGNERYDDQFLTLAWLTSCTITTAVIIYRDPSLLGWILQGAARRSHRGGSQSNIIDNDDDTLKPIVDTTPRPIYAAPLPVNPEAYNMFDPADLPPRLSEYANMVYSACEDLGNFFGFQDSSVRNQAEHLLILLSNNRRYLNSHILPPALQPPSPIHALHAKVFSNYMKWCRYQGVMPHFSRMSASAQAGMAGPPSVASRVVDLVLFFCIWGEGGNIRHMPECMWFLYHKMMEEYSSVGIMGGVVVDNHNHNLQYPQLVVPPRSLYAGHFLDYVVTPIYKIISTVSLSASWL
jgi:callose synthase